MGSIHFLQLVTVIFGISSVILSSWLSHRFWTVRNQLGKALGMMLAGEAFVSGITVFFSVSSLLGVYNTMSPEEAMVLRWLMFGVVSFTSIHLYKVMEKI